MTRSTERGPRNKPRADPGGADEPRIGGRKGGRREEKEMPAWGDAQARGERDGPNPPVHNGYQTQTPGSRSTLPRGRLRAPDWSEVNASSFYFSRVFFLARENPQFSAYEISRDLDKRTGNCSRIEFQDRDLGSSRVLTLEAAKRHSCFIFIAFLKFWSKILCRSLYGSYLIVVLCILRFKTIEHNLKHKF